MRELILLCKKYLFTRLLTTIHWPGTLFLTAGLTVSLMHGCRAQSNLDFETNLTESLVDQPLIPQSLPVEVVLLRQDAEAGTPDKGVVVAKFEAAYCWQRIASSIAWQFSFISPFGSHKIRLNQSAINNEDYRIFLDGVEYRMPSYRGEFFKEWANRLCPNVTPNSQQIFITDDGVIETLQETFLDLAPLCEFELDANRNPSSGWRCRINRDVTVADRLLRLKKMQIKMARELKRHSYLLTRKLAIGISLAEALAARDAREVAARLDLFCQVLSYAYAAELPLSVRSKNWQNAVCLKPVSYEIRLEAAMFGLVEAAKEIGILKNRNKNNSSLGTLSVRIPGNQIPSKDLWISLKHLDTKRAPLRAPAVETSSFSEDKFGICWHPLYDENRFFLDAAIKLGLVEQKQNISCQRLTSLRDSKETQVVNYIINSITSETEFPITNGRRKILRLPQGEYEYSIRSHPMRDSLSNEATGEKTPKAVAKGIISWTKKNPKAAIKAW